MPTEIRMQKLSDTMEFGTLLKWHKKPGDAIEFDDELADVETDKATMALTAPEDGILHAIYVEEGAKVPVGSPVALILEEGEEPPAEGTLPRPPPHPTTPRQPSRPPQQSL
jgi:pyruvate/2-oxoglutarate dehydrogenase complex dihydrolipoamide acyltransferase (E2) component